MLICINGAPSYLVYSLHGGWQTTERLNMILAFHNLSDEDYRIHGSGQNEPGLATSITVNYKW